MAQTILKIKKYNLYYRQKNSPADQQSNWEFVVLNLAGIDLIC